MKKLTKILSFILAAAMCLTVCSCDGKEESENKKASEAYDYLSTYSGGTIGYVVSTEEGLYGVIDAEGNYIIEPTFEKIYSTFSENLLMAQQNSALTFIDMKGNTIIESDADVLDEFYDGIAACCYYHDDTETYTYAYLSKETGELLNDITYYSAKAFSEGYGVCCEDESRLYGFIKPDGEYLVEPKYESAGSFHNGLAPVAVDGKWGFIDTDGKMVIEPAYDNVAFFTEDGLCRVCVDEKWGFIDRDGNYVIKPAYDELNDFHSDLAVVYSGGFYGVINRSGEYVLKAEYDNIYPVCDGRLAIYKDSLWGYADESGKIIVKPQYYFASSFNEGYAVAQKEASSLCGYINTAGETVVEPTFKSLSYMRNGLAIAENSDGKYGLVDTSGNYVVEAQYTSMIEILLAE